MADTTYELGEFYDYMWGLTEGFVYLPVKSDTDWTAYMFRWPAQRDAVVRHTLRWTAAGNDVFYSPAVFKKSSPKKDGVKGSWFLWVDFDGNAPKDWEEMIVPPPTLRIQSSIPGHEHCYWLLNEFLDDIPTLEDRNRALAYTLQADTSGWDADQILRPPFTTNYKRNKPVKILEWLK